MFTASIMFWNTWPRASARKRTTTGCRRSDGGGARRAVGTREPCLGAIPAASLCRAWRAHADRAQVCTAHASPRAPAAAGAALTPLPCGAIRCQQHRSGSRRRRHAANCGVFHGPRVRARRPAARRADSHRGGGNGDSATPVAVVASGVDPGAVRGQSNAPNCGIRVSPTGLSGLIFLGPRPAEPVLCESQGSDLIDETDPASCVRP